MTGNKSDKRETRGNEPVNLAERFASSAGFEELFSGGMALIEETAAYLDDEGRVAAKALGPKASAVYGAESMRLTTRLMQLASWLLLQRSVAEGEMTLAQAVSQKKTIKLQRLFPRVEDETWQSLPEAFRTLCERGDALQQRVMRLDAEIYGEGAQEAMKRPANPVAAQHSLLESAFDSRFDA